MLAFLANLFSGGAIGAITGIAGGAIQRHYDLKNSQLQMQKDAQTNTHELELRKLDIEATKAEAESNYKVSELTTQSQELAGDVQLRTASYQLEPQMYADKSKITSFMNGVFSALDVVRGLVRPGLTAYFAVFFSLITWKCFSILNHEGVSVSPDDAYELVQKCVDLAITLFSACTTFYFGTRNKASEYNARKGK